ncbi:hypothetical protein Tco_0918126, partial [Tanacetum coccineum]
TKSDLCPSFVEDLSAKGVDLRVADSRTGNHREDGFTPLETIRMFLGIFGSKSHSSSKRRPLSRRGGVPIPEFICDVNLAFAGEPNVDLLWALLNLGPTEMDFKSFMMEGVDGEFNFLPESGLDEEGNSHSIREPRQKVRKVPPQASKVIGDASGPLDVDSNPGIHGNKTHKLMSTLSKARASYDAIRERDVEKDKGYVELDRKCNEALQDLEKNALVLDMRSEMRLFEHLESEWEQLKSSEVKLLQEIDSLRQDRAAVVSKVIPHVAMKLVRSDEIGLLVARLVKAAMFRNKCIAFEEVAYFKEPFILEKIPGYRPFSGKEFDQAGDDLATAPYPFITEATVDPYATMEQLLSKKPRSLHTKPAPSYSKPLSLKAPIN